MRIAVITLFPEMLVAVTEFGVTGRAVDRGLIEILSVNPRDYAQDKHRTVDDRPYGGGPGMVMLCQPLVDSVRVAKEWAGSEARVVYLSPQGAPFTQKRIEQFRERNCNLILVAGRYEGVDERFIELEVDEEWNVGDFVVSGGELPAMMIMDALIRQIPGALGHGESAVQDSFVNSRLDCPHYTRPEQYAELSVPAVLLSGDHRKIEEWRRQKALDRTRERRPDLIESPASNEMLD